MYEHDWQCRIGFQIAKLGALEINPSKLDAWMDISDMRYEVSNPRHLGSAFYARSPVTSLPVL